MTEIALAPSPPPIDPKKDPASTPPTLAVVPDGIPDELRARPQWVRWRWDWSDERSAWTKTPLRPDRDRKASTRKPATWGSFDECVRNLSRQGAHGVGFVFTKEDPYSGVDVDACRDAVTGELDEIACGEIERFASYTETSPSGRGIHIIVRASLPGGAGCRRGQREIYCEGRYFAFTGRSESCGAATIAERQEQAAALLGELRKETPRRGPGRGSQTTEDIIARASRARNGARFARLFAGKWEGEYGSQSEADLALCSMIAFWTGKDAVQIDSLFRQSGLFRPKWDEKHYGDGRTYGEETVAKAISSTRESYRPGHRSRHGGGGDWHHQLICSVDKDGERKPKAVVANALLVLRRHSSWQGCVGWDEFGQRVVLRQRPPYESADARFVSREWGDEDDVQAAAWMQSEMRLLVNSEIARQAVATVAHEHPFHPVCDYLSGLTWDGTPRLDEWLSRYLGAVDSPYVRAVGSRWVISGVARVLQPGAKADHVLVLEGAQAIGKSSALRTLGGDWFTDELDALGSKDAAAQLHGVWIIELAELDALGRSEISRTKAFISKSFDRYRPPYGKHAVRYERQCIFAGTVNHQDYLRDETGNRRFWPIRCKAATPDGLVDIAALRSDRDQIWAEAVVRYRMGEPWWLEDRSLVQLAQVEQEQRYLVDAWEPLISRFVSQQESVSVGEVLEGLGVEIPKQGQAEQNRVARCLKHLGWTRRQRREGGYQTWRYFPPSPVPSSSPLDPEDGGDAQVRSASTPPPLQPLSPLDQEVRETEKRKEEEERGVVVIGDIWGAAGDSGDIGDGPFPDAPPLTPAHLCFCCGGREFFPVPLGEPVCVRCHPPAFLEVSK